MLNKTVVSVLAVLFCVFCTTEQAKVNVSVYYETLSSDSKDFIVNQFYPVYKEIGKEYIDVDFVPYGHAKDWIDDVLPEISCEHGVPECFGNRYHSCALYLNSDKEATSKFVNCSMSGDPSSEKSLEECSNEAGISWDDLMYCYYSELSILLFMQNGVKTRAAENTDFIPTIILNDKFDENNQQRALTDFAKLICDVLNNELEICNKH